METYRVPRITLGVAGRDDSSSKTSVRNKRRYWLGLYTKTMWERETKRENIRGGQEIYKYRDYHAQPHNAGNQRIQ